MLDRFDQAELLELVEGELRADRAAAILRKLAGDPWALAHLENLKRDRALLQAVDHPDTPVDFFAQLEPLLARPMLMEPLAGLPAKPGSFRRMHRRQTRQLRLRRYAVAAVLALAALGGIWAATSQLWPTSSDSRNVARNVEIAPSVGIATDPMIEPWPPAGSIVHHHVPTGHLLLDPSAPASDGASPAQPAAAAAQHVVVADFALSVIPSDRQSLEALLSQSIAGADSQSALVRNFSYSEAQRLVGDWQLASSARDSLTGSGAAASADGSSSQPRIAPDIRTLAQRVREHVSKAAAGRGSSPGEVAGAHLSGATALAPTLEQQLDLSSRGAVYTIGVPAERLLTALERMNFIEGCQVALRKLPPAQPPFHTADSAPRPNVAQDVPSPPDHPLALWVSEGAAARLAVQRAAEAAPGTTVLIAVLVSDPPSPAHRR